MANDYSGTGAAGSNSFRLTADGGTVSGATSVAGNPDIVLVAGANITLTGTSPNQIKITSSGGGAGGVTSVGTTLSGITVTDPTGAAVIGGTLGATSGGTSINTYAEGDIIYASGVNTLDKLAAGADTEVLTLAGGVPTWAAPTGGIGGTIAANQVAVGTGADTIGGSSSLLFTAAGGLTINTGGNDPIINLSSTTKAITLTVANNSQLTVTGGVHSFIFDASSATGGITFPDGTTQITAATGGGGITGSGTAGQLTVWDGATSVTGDAGLTYASSVITLGDGTDEDIGVLFNSDSTDYYIGRDAGTESFMWGTGTTIGSNSFLTATTTGALTMGTSTTTTVGNVSIEPGATGNLSVGGTGSISTNDGDVTVGGSGGISTNNGAISAGGASGDIIAEAGLEATTGNVTARAGYSSAIGGQILNPNGGTVPNGSDLSDQSYAGGVSH